MCFICFFMLEMSLSISFVSLLSCSTVGQNVASLEPTASGKALWDMRAIKKGWDIAVMIHKPCARTFHNGKPSPLYQENRAFKKENFSLKGMSKKNQLSQEKIQTPCMVLQSSIPECVACEDTRRCSVKWLQKQQTKKAKAFSLSLSLA